MLRIAGVAVCALTLTLVGVGCSSSSKASNSDSTTTQAPEELRTSAAAVATGLAKIETTVKQLPAAVTNDDGTAEDIDGRIEPVWRTIEGTVKANDPDSYIAFEDAFALLENAVEQSDAAKAQQGATAAQTAKAAYLAKYPG